MFFWLSKKKFLKTVIYNSYNIWIFFSLILIGLSIYIKYFLLIPNWVYQHTWHNSRSRVCRPYRQPSTQYTPGTTSYRHRHIERDRHSDRYRETEPDKYRYEQFIVGLIAQYTPGITSYKHIEGHIERDRHRDMHRDRPRQIQRQEDYSRPDRQPSTHLIPPKTNTKWQRQVEKDRNWVS